MILKALLPKISDLKVQSIFETKNSLLVELEHSLSKALCPDCQQACFRIHSKYRRCVSDLPWAGLAITIHLTTLKFFCDDVNCQRKIFTARLGKVLPPYARRTKRLNDHLRVIGFATGGNSGASLSKALGMRISPSTMLRILHQTPESNFETPKVLGIDDWAYRKGWTYGSILVDLEKQKPVDLLPDRESSTFEDWLKDHPGVEIISRDRAGSYSYGAKLGAPDAIQVADRWHLLKNLGEALKKMLDTHHRELRLAAKDVAQAEWNEKAESLKIERALEKAKVNSGNTDTPSIEDNPLSKYRLNFLEVKKLRKEGHSIRSIRRQTGIHRQTIKKYLKYEEYPEPVLISSYTAPVREYEEYIQKRWREGERNGKQLWREIRDQGFTGSYQSVYRVINKYPRDLEEAALPPPLKIRAWTANRVSLLLCKDINKLEEEEQKYLKAFIKHCPKVSEVNMLAMQFKEMTYKLKGSLLDPWIEKAKSSGISSLKNFARSLENDYDAVKAAVSLEWSNGQVEGQINRLKTIKRQMYGRASFRLLRKRVLANTS